MSHDSNPDILISSEMDRFQKSFIGTVEGLQGKDTNICPL